MKGIIKWVGIGLGSLVGLVILAVVAVYVLSSLRMNRTYTLQPEPIEIPAGAAAVERGLHIATTRGCADCHRENLAGGVVIEDPAIGGIYATNLTTGQGGIAHYTDLDWVRAIRNGVRPDGKPLIFMPSHEYYYMGDEDLGALIAYLKTVPAVDNQLPAISAGPMGRVLFLAGQLDLVPAEKIDHDAPRPSAPPPGVTEAYGQYLAVGCTGCHGPGYSGGPIPGVPPDWPPATNLTPAGQLAAWSQEDFINTLRTGVTPDGRELNPEYMPWPTFGRMTDDELKAILVFLKSLPARETGNR